MSQPTFSREELTILKVWRRLTSLLSTDKQRSIYWDGDRQVVVFGKALKARHNTFTLQVEFEWPSHPDEWVVKNFFIRAWILGEMLKAAERVKSLSVIWPTPRKPFPRTPKWQLNYAQMALRELQAGE